VAFFRTKVWEKDEILEVAKRKGEFIVDRNMYRYALLRKKLRKIAKDPTMPLKFSGYTQTEVFYKYAPEKLVGSI
jgi:hypothetical protein